MLEIRNNEIEKAIEIYLRAGFEIVKVIKFDNGKEMALYELKV